MAIERASFAKPWSPALIGEELEQEAAAAR